ncbi:MAG: hypothetical protein AAGE99_03260 [Chlamydiota bacterium]
MSVTIEADQTSGSTMEEYPLHWGAEVPEELREEASSVSKLAFDLFQKLKAHPDVYIPYNRDKLKNRCRFFWTNNQGQSGKICLDGDITIENGNKKELPRINVCIFYHKTLSKSPTVNSVTFAEEKMGNEWTTMPVELRQAAENLIKVAARFFRKLVQHPAVIAIDGGDRIADWERFCRYHEKGNLYSSIAFSDGIHECFFNRFRSQRLDFQRH